MHWQCTMHWQCSSRVMRRTLLNLLSLSTSFTSFILVSSQMGLPSNRGAYRDSSSTQAATAAGMSGPSCTL
jgi:hypothetical protein